MDTADSTKRYPYSVENDYLLERRAEELASLRKPVEADVLPMLRLRIAGIEFAIDQMHVRQIISPLSLVPVPFADPCIKGITHIRGDLVSVVDLAVLLGAPVTPNAASWHAVLLDNGDSPFCIALDDAPETYVLSREDVMTDDTYAIEWVRPVIDSMFLFDHTPVGILSIQRLISHQCLRALSEANGHGA